MSDRYAPAPASEALFARALAVTPGGVNSPVRAFRAVGGTPRFMVSGRGAVPHRRRRPRVRRPGLLVGSDDPRPRAPGGRRGGPGRGRARHVVRHADRGRGRAGRGDRAPGRRPSSRCGWCPRHRGDDVGDPAGPRLHRPHQGGEVRRLLPRPRRRAARRGRLRRRDARPAGHAGRDRGAAPPTRSCCRTTTSPPSRARSPTYGGADRLRHHRGGRRQHGRRPAGARLQRRARASCAGATARCSSATR